MTQLCKCYDDKFENNNNKHTNRNKKTNILEMQWFSLVSKNHIYTYSPLYLEELNDWSTEVNEDPKKNMHGNIQ